MFQMVHELLRDVFIRGVHKLRYAFFGIDCVGMEVLEKKYWIVEYMNRVMGL